MGAILGIAFFIIVTTIHINPIVTTPTSQYVAITNSALETLYYIIRLILVTVGIAGLCYHLKYDKKRFVPNAQMTVNKPMPIHLEP
jgi:hypothetical protein